MKEIKVEWCENFIRAAFTKHHAFPGPNADIEINCFWDMAERSGLWVRGTYDSPMSQALENLVEVDAFCKPEHFLEFLPEYRSLDELKAHYRRGGLGDVKIKKFLNSVMQAELAPIRKEREMWEKRIPDVRDILRQGCDTARAVAAQTLYDVRAAMKINYFEDESWLCQ